MVSCADRQLAAATLAAGFWIVLGPDRTAPGRTRDESPAAHLSGYTGTPSSCCTLPGGARQACRAGAAGDHDAGSQPLVDRAKLDGGRREVILLCSIWRA